jgi:hypothetical protein
VEIRVVSDAQDSYAGLPETVPAMILLPVAITSQIPQSMVRTLEEELRRQLVNDKRLKPVTMGKWLASAFGQRKADNPFELFAAIRAEQYTVPLQVLCRPSMFRSQDYFVVHLDVFSLAGTPYPVSVLRFFREEENISQVVSACLEELYLRFFLPGRGAAKKRIVVDSFKLEFRKLLELESGEFEFIGTPFISQYGMPLREGDDFFSLLLGYSLAATDMVQVMRLADFSDYAGDRNISLSQADYIIRGRVQLSDEMNVLYADVYAPGGGAKIAGIRHPFKEPGFKNIWDACQEAAALITGRLFPPESFGVVPPLEARDQGFFAGNMFIGWDRVPRYVLPRGMHEIATGSYLRQTEDEVFYVLLDTENRVFTGREGKYVWNLLKKRE